MLRSTRSRSDFLPRSWCKWHLTLSESTQTPRNPLRFFAIFLDFCAHTGLLRPEKPPLHSFRASPSSPYWEPCENAPDGTSVSVTPGPSHNNLGAASALSVDEGN